MTTKKRRLNPVIVNWFNLLTFGFGLGLVFTTAMMIIFLFITLTDTASLVDVTDKLEYFDTTGSAVIFINNELPFNNGKSNLLFSTVKLVSRVDVSITVI